MMEIYSFKINDITNKLTYSNLIPFISIEKQILIKRFRKIEDVNRALLAEILIRTIIIKKLNITNEEIVFENNLYGKPALKWYNNFHYNISHSGNWIICAIDDTELGVDIQKIQPVDLDIAKHFFSKEEYYELMKKNDCERLTFFYELWTLKESYIKAIGKGLSIPLDSFSLNINEKEINICSLEEDTNLYFKQYNITSNYKMAVCGFKNEFCNTVKNVTPDEIYAEMLKNRLVCKIN